MPLAFIENLLSNNQKNTNNKNYKDWDKHRILGWSVAAHTCRYVCLCNVLQQHVVFISDSLTVDQHSVTNAYMYTPTYICMCEPLQAGIFSRKMESIIDIIIWKSSYAFFLPIIINKPSFDYIITHFLSLEGPLLLAPEPAFDEAAEGLLLVLEARVRLDVELL